MTIIESTLDTRDALYDFTLKRNVDAWRRLGVAWTGAGA